MRSPTTILVTGGAGFLGARLVQALLRSESNRVIVYDDLSTGIMARLPRSPRLSLVEADILDEVRLRDVVAVARPASVFHLAAMHFIPHCESLPDRTWQVNVEGTQGLLAACEAHPPRTLLFASTGAVYGDVSGPVSENALPAPSGIYARSKLAAERLVEAFAGQFPTRATIARFFNLFGPGSSTPHVIPDILQQLRHGDDLSLGNLDTVRDYLHVDDALSGLLALSERAHRPQSAASNVFNVGSGEGRTVAAIVAALSLATGRSLRVTRDQARVRAGETFMLLADVSKIGLETGWKPALSFEAGLQHLLAGHDVSSSGTDYGVIR